MNSSCFLPRHIQRNRAAHLYRIAVLAALPFTAVAQLNENCIVSVLNRNTQVRPNGSWVLPNIPAGFGFVRARASCVDGATTTFGESALFQVPANASVNLPPIVLGNTTPIPTALTITAPTTNLTAAGQTVQLTVTATFASGPSQNVTAASAGTAYTISNSAIATISANGLVTAVRTGTAVIQAIKEGRSAVMAISVTLAGRDSDSDGIPDDAEIRLGLNPNDPTDALLDLDHDGLTNLEEYRLGTDLQNADTDGDGINDGDEVNGRGLACAGTTCYRTNPLLPDTDGDGIWDRTEILSGSDPTNPASINFARSLRSIAISPCHKELHEQYRPARNRRG